MRASIFTVLTAAAGMLAAPALAEAPPVPTDPVAKAAYDVLEKSCARCHQEGMLKKREKAASSLGYILDLERLEKTKSPKYIDPGNPDNSELMKRTQLDMPYDVYQGDIEAYSPTADEKLALRTWIEQLGQTSVASCGGGELTSLDSVVGRMFDDLETLPDARAKTTRYVVLTHLANNCVNEELEVYRQGVVKLLNSLSRSSTIVLMEPIDEERTVLRVNLADLGWTASDWETVLSFYPYGMQPESRLFESVTRTTGTEMPFVNGDWLAFTAARPPLYEHLLDLPANFKELQVQLGVDIDANIASGQAKRAGFMKSGISANNRLIERHAARTGMVWTSYDFAANRTQQNLLDFPLGPGGANGFVHDGGETIFTLPNGFFGYYLNTADGTRLDVGPTEIVRDRDNVRDPRVINGISCMGCHRAGMREASDDVRPHIEGNLNLSKDMRETVELLYPPREEMDAIIAADKRDFEATLLKAGLQPGLEWNGAEMINAVAKRYELDVDLETAAAELWMTPEEFVSAAEMVGGEVFQIRRRLEQGVLPRDRFEEVYPDLLAKLTDREPVEVVASIEDNIHLVVPKARPTTSFDFSLTSDKSRYRVDDKPIFTVTSAKDCFLTLIALDQKGNATVLFPNGQAKDNRLAGGTTQEFPNPSSGFDIVVQPDNLGEERVVAVCDTANAAPQAVSHDFARSDYTEVQDYVARSLAAVPRKRNGEKAQAAVKFTTAR